MVDAYDTSLTRTTIDPLSETARNLAAASVGTYALFGGGCENITPYRSAVTAYNASLTRTIMTDLSEARYDLAAASVGDYALFGGGRGDSASAVVDAYTI